MAPVALPLTIKILVVSTVLIAAVYDLRDRRIPNWVCFAALLLGVFGNVLLLGMGGALSSLEGIGLAMLIYLPLYLLKGMGAGDVKLMMAIGAAVGPLGRLQIFAITAVVGGILGLIFAFWRKRLFETLWNTRGIVSDLLQFRLPHRTNPDLHVKNRDALRLPHGVSIAVGSLAVVCFRIFRWL